MAQDQSEKDFLELQQKLMDNASKLKACVASIRTKESDKKRSELTEQELVELPDKTVVYKSLGRAFVLAPKPEVQADMSADSKRLGEEIEKGKAQKAHLERTQVDIETQIKELIQSTPLLKAKLMGGRQ